MRAMLTLSLPKMLTFVVCIGLACLPNATGQEPITPDSQYVRKMVLSGLVYLKEKYDEKGDYGNSSMVGLAIFNAGLRLGKGKRELQADPILKDILDRVSNDVLKTTPDGEQTVLPVCVTGILLLEVDEVKYEKQINHALKLVADRQLASGAWGRGKETEGEMLQTQFASLFLWLAFEKRFRVKATTVLKATQFLVAVQNPSGGFADKAEPGKASQQMTLPATAAAMASLHVFGDVLGIRDGQKERIAGFGDSKTRGDKWLNQHLSIDSDKRDLPDRPYTFLYNFSQYSSFKEKSNWNNSVSPKWYVDGASFLKEKQQSDGSWLGNQTSEKSKDYATSLAILFLVRNSELLIPRYMDIVEGGAKGLPAKGPLPKIKPPTDPADHWIIKYSTGSKQAYTDQLDFFRIELASLSRDSEIIEYATNLSGPKPDYRKGSRKDESRAYFRKPTKHPAIDWDKEYLKAAGAETKDRDICAFYPAPVYRKLYQLEQYYVRRDNKQIKDVRRATFTVIPTSAGYEIRLNSVRYK